MQKNNIKIYAKALVGAILAKKADEKKIIDNFVKLLVKTGQEKKAKEILEAAENIFVKKTGRRKIVIETARALKPKQKELIESIMQKGDIVNKKINKDLIAGIKITVNDSQLDMSMQHKINNIF